MKIMKRTISFWLAIFMILNLFLLISCDAKKAGDPVSDGGQNNIAAEDGQDNGPEATEAKILPDLPADVNYNGYVFTVLSHQESTDDWVDPDPREIVAEVENGEPVNDAVYKRNSVLKDRYNIDFKLITNTDERSLLSKTVKSGDDAYDAILIFNNNVPGTITGGLLTNVANLPYVDLNKPWWDPAVNSMSIDHKNYLLAGDMLILDNEATNALLFNKDLMASLGFDLPYNLVKEGAWTLDKLNGFVKGSSSDLNGDGKMTPNEDRWGFLTFNDTLHAFLVSGGGALAVKDEDDLPYMDFTSQRNLAVIDKAMDIMYNKQDVLNIQSDITTPGANSINWFIAYHGSFEENRALFMWVRMRVVEKFRGMDANFGIIPLPKFDEAQDKYYSLVNPYTGVLLGVPKTAGDLERTSIVLEAMAAESRYTLQPAYYDIVLQRKFTRDEESSEMLDIIFGANASMGERIYDIGAVYSFGNVFLDFIALCGKSNRNVASYYEKKMASMQKAIDKVVNTFQDMD